MLAGCAARHPPAEALIARASEAEFGDGEYGCSETIDVAAKAGIDYVATVDRAMKRDRQALHTLFWLTAHAGFDAASSEGNSAVLGNPLRDLGDRTFGSVLSTEPPATRSAVLDMLRYDFGVDAGLKETWLTGWYPRTFNPPPEG